MTDFSPRLRDARKALNVARKTHATKKTFDTALSLQKAQKELDEAAKEERQAVFVLDGGRAQHTLSEVEILCDALKEIKYRCTQIKNKDLPASIDYVHHVAAKALDSVGR